MYAARIIPVYGELVWDFLFYHVVISGAEITIEYDQIIEFWEWYRAVQCLVWYVMHRVKFSKPLNRLVYGS